ncbi:MAG: hypothetical protein ACTS5F_01935 [Candidatus Hodgkinia cicadicola]
MAVNSPTFNDAAARSPAELPQRKSNLASSEKLERTFVCLIWKGGTSEGWERITKEIVPPEAERGSGSFC